MWAKMYGAVVVSSSKWRNAYNAFRKHVGERQMRPKFSSNGGEVDKEWL